MVAVGVHKMLAIIVACTLISYILQGCDSAGSLLDVVPSASWKEVGKGKCNVPQDGDATEIEAKDEDQCQAECEHANCDAYAFSPGKCSMVWAPVVGSSDVELTNLGYLEGHTDGDGNFTCYRKMACEHFVEGTYHDSWVHWNDRRNFEVKVVDECDLHFTYGGNLLHDGQAKVAFLLGKRVLVNGWHLGEFQPNAKDQETAVVFSDKGKWYRGSVVYVDDDP